ncbi:MAG: tRNA pseudouridine(55) synthase TruB [Thermomicrobiales bacterium]
MAKNRRSATRHGYIVIDKPGGWTSHDVVARVRRIVRERRVGHAGTLDPAAVGVLPIAVGLATRTVEYLADAQKAYRAEITFGVETDSADGDGVVIAQRGADGLTREMVEAALASFRGPQMQVPPLHSAVQIDGKRLYELAHAGIEAEVEIPARAIVIHAIDLVTWEHPIATVDITCSKGTYVRSIARDLGELVGTGAYLSNLVRTSTGPFTLADAMTLDELEARLRDEPWDAVAAHPDRAVEHLPALVVTPEQRVWWFQGKVLPVRAAAGSVRVYDSSGIWVGVGVSDGESIQPAKVVDLDGLDRSASEQEKSA